MLTKNDLKAIEKLTRTVIREEAVTKDEARNFATKDDLRNFATKDDLRNFATKDDLKDAVSQIVETMDRGFSVTASNDEVKDHEKRISRLETAVFPA